MDVPSTIPVLPTDGAALYGLARGASVGRYLVLEKIGEGGMGSVYAAYDPRLDRKVALKVIKPSLGAKQDTMVIEAKAMARLAHPNVVTVFDVVVEGGTVCIAMELVDGKSLREWREEGERSPREVLAMYLQAARGLAAAHAAGIVHRDFKPDNVLVGRDGRARVADFGLSVGMEGAPPPSRSDSAAARSGGTGSSRGFVGLLVGTPQYMSPEQFAGRSTGPATDQFAFCASLWEALYGELPFESEGDLLALLANINERRLRRAGGSAPTWLRLALERGLQPDAAERYASMTALVEALEDDPRKRRWRTAIAGIVVAALLSGAAGVALHRRAEALSCKALERRLDGVWDDVRRGAVQAAFVGTGKAYAADAFERVARELDTRAASWKEAATLACEEKRDPPAVAARRAECFDERLLETRALVDVLTRADSKGVERAVQAARALPAVSSCAGADPVVDRPRPSDPAVRARVIAREDRMRTTDALRATAQYSAAVPAAEADLRDAEAIGFAPLVANALLALGRIQLVAGTYEPAKATLRRAVIAAEGSVMGETAARSWMSRASVELERGDYSVIDEQLELAEAWASRYGKDSALRGELLLVRAGEGLERGNYDETREAAREARAIFERLGSDQAIMAINDLGAAADLQGRYEEARGYYEHALAARERLLGPDHPLVAAELENLGMMIGDTGHPLDEIPLLERALRIRVGAGGPEHPHSLDAEVKLAAAYTAADLAEKAIPLVRHAMTWAPRVYGEDSPNASYAFAAAAEALLQLHRPEEAIEPATRALALREREGVAPLLLAESRAKLGLALLESGRDRARGRSLAEKGRDELTALGRTVGLEDIDAALSRAR